MENEGAEKSDDADIWRQVWDEKEIVHLPHVQYLTWDIKSNSLENIHNEALCYWRYWLIKSFIRHMIEIYGESWEKFCGS